MSTKLSKIASLNSGSDSWEHQKNADMHNLLISHCAITKRTRLVSRNYNNNSFITKNGILLNQPLRSELLGSATSRLTSRCDITADYHHSSKVAYLIYFTIDRIIRERLDRQNKMYTWSLTRFCSEGHDLEKPFQGFNHRCTDAVPAAVN